jgi:hypothetical protein
VIVPIGNTYMIPVLLLDIQIQIFYKSVKVHVALKQLITIYVLYLIVKIIRLAMPAIVIIYL